MSLIESALEKLRRAGDSTAVALPTAPPVRVPSGAVGSKPTVLPPAPDYVHRQIVIDTKALRNAGYLPDEGLERRFADHYRQIKRPLIEKALTGAADARTIMVSSALPGDGKTFTSINLAMSIARERDISILLLDADAPRAQVSQVFGLRGERGLLDALRDDSVEAESLILGTDVPGLEILPAGRFVDSATELFASARMDQIIARIAARNPRRLVLLDSAPLLVSSEARALLRVPGQVVLVARTDATPRHALRDAVNLVDKNKLQGVILNYSPFHASGGYYYGYTEYSEGAGSTPEGV